MELNILRIKPRLELKSSSNMPVFLISQKIKQEVARPSRGVRCVPTETARPAREIRGKIISCDG